MRKAGNTAIAWEKCWLGGNRSFPDYGTKKMLDDMGRRMKRLIQEGVTQRIFPGAVALVARAGKIVFLEHVGHRSLIPETMPISKDTIFDLASLTKPLATTLCIMKLVDDEKLFLDQSLGEMLSHADLKDKGNVTLRLVLTHSAGLTDWKPFYEKLMEYPLQDRKRMLREWIIEEPFAYKPGRGNVYSDLGFMLLEWVIEEQTGLSLPQHAHAHFYGPLGLKRTFFRGTREKTNPPRPPFTKGGSIGEGREMDSRLSILRSRTTAEDGRGNDKPFPASYGTNATREEFAATEDCPLRKRVLLGEVHDDNAWALEGYSGHAGLFSTAEEVYGIANMLREHHFGTRADFFKPDTVREFFRRQDVVPGSDWALGWDTRALEGSSAGKYFSRDSVGHTGFTGTSVWMDFEKDVIAILLTNRVHPKRDNDKIKQFRPVFHDAVMGALGLVG
jgi:serine-type D-Ala-D-Ala carboxypeptidase